jgi:hypothetical protein
VKPIFEFSRFSDGRLMIRVRFFRNSNFWIHSLEEATWVPTLDEVAFLKEVLDVTNEHNEIKRAMGHPTEANFGNKE